MSDGYTINRWKGHIRGIHDTKTPHKPCPKCYANCTSTDTGQLIRYACPRGHTFTGYRNEGLNHATFLARYYAGTEPLR